MREAVRLFVCVSLCKDVRVLLCVRVWSKGEFSGGEKVDTHTRTQKTYTNNLPRSPPEVGSVERALEHHAIGNAQLQPHVSLGEGGGRGLGGFATTVPDEKTSEAVTRLGDKTFVK